MRTFWTSKHSVGPSPAYEMVVCQRSYSRFEDVEQSGDLLGSSPLILASVLFITSDARRAGALTITPVSPTPAVGAGEGDSMALLPSLHINPDNLLKQ